MGEVEEDVQSKQVIADVEKDDVMKQLSTENKRLLDLINQLEERIVEKDQQIAEAEKQITDKNQQITEKDGQIEKYQQMTTDVRTTGNELYIAVHL